MKNLLKALSLFVALFAFMQGVWAQTFITDVMIISGNQSQTDGYKTQYQSEGWTVIDNDLNAGAGGNFIYLLYKTNESSGSSGSAVTGFYLKTGNDDHPNTITHDGHTYSLVPAVGAYDLNCGAGGAYIFLYYTKEAFSPGRMVTDIYFNNNSNGALGANGGSSGFDLNSGAGGDYIYMHVVTITTDGIIDVYTETQLRDAVMLNDANIRMMADINITSEVEINNNRTVTLDLNGHTLDRGLSSATNYGHALKVISGSTLTINDASGDNSGIIKGAYTGQGGGIRNYGTIIINGGTIRDNHSGTKGGGINNHNGASLTINGGVITNNEAEDGAGIYNEATGTITLNNGSITGNTTNRYGGGGITNYGTLALYGGTVSNNTAIQDGGGIWTDNSLTVSGATIEGNSARDGSGICINHGTADLTNVTISGNTSKDGGGIYVYSVGTLTFNSGSISDNTTTEYGGGGIANHGNTTIIGGSITGNTAMENGGGIWSGKTLTIKGGTITGNRTGNGRLGDGVHFYGGTFNLEGNPQIYGNLKTNGQPGTNVFLPSGKKITVSGAFTEGADVGIAMEHYDVFTTGFTSHNTASPVAIFTPDNATFYVTLDGEEARLNIDLSVVSYVDRAWDSVNRVVTAQVKTCTSFTKLEGSNSNSCTELGDGWYVVYKNVSYKKCLKMVGDVHLILVDGATLNVKDGIYIKKDNTFTVYAQEAGLGKIYAHPGSGPGIGGMKNKTAGHFVVKGGIIDARAGANRNAGIGSYGSVYDEVGGDGGSIYINGGNIFAMSAGKGAGIGGGNGHHGGEIHINGGNVNAIGGYCEYSYFADHGPTFINLGYDVNPAYSMAATALMTFFEEWLHSGTFGGAGIGGGDHGSGATVNITGGTVKAQGGMNSCRAIGKGNGGSNNGSLSIYNKARVYVGVGNDSVVQWKGDRITACQGNKAVAVTHCIHDSLTYAIFDGEKHIDHCFHCDHIAVKFHVFDDQGRCTLCGYGKPTYTVTVYMPAESCDGTYESVTYTVGQGKDFQLPESISRIGALQFVGWMLGTPADVQGYEWIDYEPLCAENGIYSNVTSDLSFIARYAEYWDGTGMGTIGDPYLIATTADLDQLATRVNEGQDFLDKYFLLVEDLAYDGTANNYTSIGGTLLHNRYTSFNGTFDGDGHSISGINIQSGIFRGVFGYLGANGNITRLTVSDCTFKGSAYIGSIVGSNEGTVDHCLVLGGTVQGSTSCGHVIGYNIKKTLFNYYTANDNLDGIGESNSASTEVNLFGGDKGYTIHCAEGLSFEYVNGSVAGSYDDALIVHDGTLYAAAGVTISFKVSLAMGFGIESLMCNGTEITPNSRGVYTFTMPAADVSITSTLLQTTFITEGNWHDEANWSHGLPSEGSDVVIAAPATIHGIVNVGYVTFENGGSITIADGGQLIHADNVRATLQKEIIGYDEDNDGWYTIASPSTSPVSTANLITESEYDLYLYHEPTHYWWNAKSSDHGFNALRDLEGYLYANEEKVTLSFTGNMQATDNTVTIPLSHNNSAGSLKGFNLVGNPFTRGLTEGDHITIGDDVLTTYLLADGDGELVSYALAERPIEPGEGFFVQATEPGQNLVINSVTRGGQSKEQPAYFRIEVGKEGYYDHAYVQFGGGNTLRKMKLSDNIPSVSVWHNGEDWAAATLESATGELPVNFKATENGAYTISVSTENLELDYLHLIDNKTGAEVDLLQTPSYTFEAKVTDYESRFKLVFSTQVPEPVEGPNQPFAFISNGEIIINGEGILQVIDMTGRIIISRDGVHTVSTNGMTPGVYVLRLINDEKVKTQKIVIQ